MREALEKIKEEMGPDAFILGTKQIRKKGPLGFGDRKFLQVTAAVEDDAVPPKKLETREKEPEPSIDVKQDGEAGFATVAAATQAQEVATYNAFGRASAASDEPVEKSTGPFSESFEAVFREARAKPRSGSEEKGNRPLRKELDEIKTMVAGLGGQSTDLSPIQRDLDELKGLLYNVIRSQTPIFGKSLSPTLLAHFQRLKDSGVDEAVAAKLIQIADDKLSDKEKDNSRKAVAYIRAMIKKAIDVSDMRKRKKGRIAALVGPTGVGKTTTLAKLAAFATLQEQLKVALITLDTYRIAAVEQLKTYAKIMDIPVQVALNINELRQAIQFHQDKDMILIDTAGHSQRDQAGMDTLCSFLQDQSDIEVHLVLSATTKGADLNDIVEKFEVLHPNYLIFSKMDETSAYGPLFNQIVRTKKPVSYVTTGQNVPEDFEFANRDMLADLVIGRNLELVTGGKP